MAHTPFPERRSLTDHEAEVLARAVSDAINATWKLLHGYEARVVMTAGALKTNGEPGAYGLCTGGLDRSQEAEAWFSVSIESQPPTESTG